MKSMLGNIKDFCNNFASVISDVVNTDVIITDSKMNIVGSAFQYFSLYNDIKIGSLVADVIVNNHNVVIDDKSKVESCRECEKFKVCKMKAFIGVPIRYENRVLGAISLVIPGFKVKSLFDSCESTIKFMENMAELVAVRMINHVEKKGLKRKISEIEKVMDIIEDAVLYTDSYGVILYMNNSFMNTFSGDREWIGQNIVNIYPAFEIYYREQKELENLRVSLNYDNKTFYGTVTLKKIYISETEYGIVICFKTFKDLKKNTNRLLTGTYVTFEWLQPFISAELIKKTSEFAEKDVNKLITGTDNVLNELVAKAIYNRSSRRNQGLTLVYIETVYRELLDSYIFGKYGLIRNMDGGTMIIISPEKMNFYVQEKIAEFIKTGRLETGDKEKVYPDVRFIFCSDKNLARLTSDGQFSKKLYYCISENEIEIDDTVYNNYLVFRKMVLSGLDYYCNIYHKKKINLKGIDIKYMWEKFADMPIGYLDKLLEKTALDGKIYREEIKPEGVRGGVNLESLRELEIKRIEELIKKGYSQKQISEILGISRTTLFRRMKKYNL